MLSPRSAFIWDGPGGAHGRQAFFPFPSCIRADPFVIAAWAPARIPVADRHGISSLYGSAGSAGLIK